MRVSKPFTLQAVNDIIQWTSGVKQRTVHLELQKWLLREVNKTNKQQQQKQYECVYVCTFAMPSLSLGDTLHRQLVLSTCSNALPFLPGKPHTISHNPHPHPWNTPTLATPSILVQYLVTIRPTSIQSRNSGFPDNASRTDSSCCPTNN